MREFTPRVAFFTDSFQESNGVARTSREFAGYARASFFPFLAVYPSKRTAHLRRGNYEALELAPSPATLQLEHDLTFDLLFARHLPLIRRALREFRPDLIHITGPGHCGILGAILAHDLGVPLVASWHTNVHEYAGRRLAHALKSSPSTLRSRFEHLAEQRSLDLTLRFYKLAKLLFAPNPELVSMLEARTGRPVHLMERGIDCRLFTPDRRNAMSQPFTIGYVGRLSAEKNVRLLAELDSLLRSIGRSRHRFLIVGAGAEQAWLHTKLTDAEFTGLLHGEALADAYARMDVFVFPSETDTYGNVVQEALASGVPCVVSDRGGPQFLIESGRTGFVASRPDAYATAVNRLQNDQQLRDEMRFQARSAALERSWHGVFDRVYGAYRVGFRDGTLGLRASKARAISMRTRRAF